MQDDPSRHRSSSRTRGQNPQTSLEADLLPDGRYADHDSSGSSYPSSPPASLRSSSPYSESPQSPPLEYAVNSPNEHSKTAHLGPWGHSRYLRGFIDKCRPWLIQCVEFIREKQDTTNKLKSIHQLSEAINALKEIQIAVMTQLKSVDGGIDQRTAFNYLTNILPRELMAECVKYKNGPAYLFISSTMLVVGPSIDRNIKPEVQQACDQYHARFSKTLDSDRSDSPYSTKVHNAVVNLGKHLIERKKTFWLRWQLTTHFAFLKAHAEAWAKRQERGKTILQGAEFNPLQLTVTLQNPSHALTAKVLATLRTHLGSESWTKVEGYFEMQEVHDGPTRLILTADALKILQITDHSEALRAISVSQSTSQSSSDGPISSSDGEEEDYVDEDDRPRNSGYGTV